MKAIEPNSIESLSFILSAEEKSFISNGAKDRAKQQIVEHIYSGVDVVLVTSTQREKESSFIQSCFKNCSDKIRTIFLSSQSFTNQDPNANTDLSMVSAIVYESIHLDEHFSIILNDADQLPINILNELIKLALGINSSKNNVSFIFSGGPSLLATIEQISNIRRLSLAHCSLDELTSDDIDAYIEEKQSNIDATEKLSFNKFSLKKISAQSNGSLFNASVLLEWCRAYSVFTQNKKITVGFIDDLTKHLSQLSIDAGSTLIANYPPVGFKFDSSISPQFTPEKESDANTRTPDEITQAPKSKVSKTVYVEEKSQRKDKTAKIYERFMNDPSEKSLTSKDHSDSRVTKLHKSNIDETTSKRNDSAIENGDHLDDSTIDTIDEYHDTYHITAVEELNTPFQIDKDDLDNENATLQKLVKPKSHTKHSPMFSVLLILLGLVCVYYFWVIYSSTNFDLSDKLNAYSFLTPNETSVPQNQERIELQNIISTENELKTSAEKQNEQTIESLLALAQAQILDKKLSTPSSDNALNTYRMILQFDPLHEEALHGIQKIRNQYQSWAKLDIEQGKINRAKYFLKRAIDISPDDTESKRLLASLD